MAWGRREEKEGRSRGRQHHRTRSPSPLLGRNDWNTGGDTGHSSMRHSVPYRTQKDPQGIERQHRRITSSHPSRSSKTSISKSNVKMSAPGTPSARLNTSAQYERGRGPLVYHLDRDRYLDHV